MQLSYTIEKDDWLEFSSYHTRTSPTVRRNIRKNQLFTTFGILIIFGFFSWLAKSAGFAVVGSIVTVLFFFLLPSHIRKKFQQQFRSMVDEGKNQAVLGPKHMSTTPAGITISSQDSESTIGWSAIERIESTDSHTFVFVSALSACIIPRHRVSTGDYEQFVKDLRNLAAINAEA